MVCDDAVKSGQQNPFGWGMMPEAELEQEIDAQGNPVFDLWGFPKLKKFNLNCKTDFELRTFPFARNFKVLRLDLNSNETFYPKV